MHECSVAGGDLFGFVRMHDDSGHSLKGAQVKWLAFQLARALDYLHRQAKTAHRGEHSAFVYWHISGLTWNGVRRYQGEHPLAPV